MKVIYDLSVSMQYDEELDEFDYILLNHHDEIVYYGKDWNEVYSYIVACMYEMVNSTK